ncbi:patatin-like phospholipase family protein [Rhizobium leguminosarum]|uniref:CBASS cGAMP-activated phospholipase n=1 Tax=Rhizobium leguminosarum TaxID=384 RepID=UPI001C94CBA0|nr:CBASS cGAMP-activated phospholipase [Rhizobium leguminosarum]MBY5396964.1 patatin-like phospholipase family protein [Rhizobium leguminosarum]
MRILSIDGGGIRGILPASILALCEERFCGGRSAGAYFDFIAGTSTGGIIALGLSVGMTAKDILRIYVDYGQEIFPPRPTTSLSVVRRVLGWREVLRDLANYKYDRAALSKHLAEVFGDRLLGDAERRLVIPSFDEYNEVHLFKTPHHPDYRKDWQERMVDVALSTSAAPTFFSTYKNGDRHFADGGVWANNPVMTALVDALACYDVDRHKIHILSLGCLEAEFKFTAGQILKGGIWHWKNIISSAMRLQSQNALGQSGLLVGRDRLLRLDAQPASGTVIALDDYRRSVDELPKFAEQIVSENRERLSDFFSVPRPAFDAVYGARAPATPTA